MSSSAYARKLKRLAWAEAGLCSRCGKQPPVEGRQNCEVCREQVRACFERWYAAGGNVRLREVKERRRQAGVCVICGKRPAESGKTKCSPCLADQSAYNVAYHRAHHPKPAPELEPTDEHQKLPLWIERGRARYGLPR